MVNVALRHTPNRDEAEDIVQNAAIKLISQQTLPADERGLAYTVTNHAAYDFFDSENAKKRDRRKTELLDEGISKHHQSSPSAEEEALNRLYLKEVISIAPQEVLALACGYTMREISEKLNLHPECVSSRIRYFRKSINTTRKIQKVL